jgi:hypothetical protein
MAKSATIQIGNSDDKLTQSEWSEFVSAVQDLIMDLQYNVHFHGCSIGSAPWQNACWVVELTNDGRELKRMLARLAFDYQQDSIALTIGEVQFISASNS